MANANDSSDQIDFTRFYRPKQYSFSTNIFDLQTGPLKRNINWNWIKYDDRLKAFWLVHVFICICVSFSDLFSRYIDKCIDRYRISVDLIYIYISIEASVVIYFMGYRVFHANSSCHYIFITIYLWFFFFGFCSSSANSSCLLILSMGAIWR